MPGAPGAPPPATRAPGPPPRAPSSPGDADTRPLKSRTALGARETATTLLGRWWPPLTAATAAALTVAGGGDNGELVFLLFTLPVMYLGIAVLDRPGTSWLMVVSVTALHFLLEAAGLTPWPVVLGLGVLLVVLGLVRGPLRRPGVFALQTPALALFGGAGLLTLVVPPEAAVAVVAVGLLAHAAWDTVHWWTRKVISRSLAEWCMVCDTAVGAAILVVLLVRAF
ncbi:hypothetical protein [Nocardiopsis sp. B62]|uniref:hypothetical protein n=1 Tax=Nocardiopsis sp. B62 TaxID=2824874 RepID=UPI001B38C3E5|nr:hypothetical protein [Nocardiopsis sp. B62]MBQ1084263.1 hypothetical protein [Nocardiopsis sp. B62]